jgi:Domain of unknown function (DUF222)
MTTVVAITIPPGAIGRVVTLYSRAALCVYEGLRGGWTQDVGCWRLCRADALVDLASRQLQSGDLPTAHGQRPHLTVAVSLDALQRRDGAAPAELGGVGAIHPQTARRIACDAVRTVAVVSSEDDGSAAGAVAAGEEAGSAADHGLSVERDAGSTLGSTLSVGRATRTIPAAIRTALALRDKGCRFPGCDRPPGWTDGHHIHHWADHGETEVPNLVSLCRRHHHMVHERGWSIRLQPDGSVAVAEPQARVPLVRRL